MKKESRPISYESGASKAQLGYFLARRDRGKEKVWERCLPGQMWSKDASLRDDQRYEVFKTAKREAQE